jgi:hypothetical protein
MKSKILAFGFVFLFCAESAFAAVILIDTSLTPPAWDPTSLTQTGLVGSTPVTVTTGDTAWNPTFTNDSTHYANTTVWGSLAQPAGTIGDFFNNTVQSGDLFDIAIQLGGPLLDPILYIGDIDAIGSAITFPSGGNTKVVYSGQSPGAGAFVGDTLLHQVNSPTGTTSGTNGAIQYLGLFPTNHIFTLTFDFRNIDLASENVGLGIAATEVVSTNVPEPAALSLLCFGLIGTMLASRQRRTRRAR